MRCARFMFDGSFSSNPSKQMVLQGFGTGRRRHAPAMRAPSAPCAHKKLRKIYFVGIHLACTVVAIFTTTTEEHICSSEAALPSPKSYNYLSITTATKRNETAERVTTQGFDRESNLEMGVAKKLETSCNHNACSLRRLELGGITFTVNPVVFTDFTLL